MKWKNLLNDRCPICGAKIYSKDTGVTCSGKGCDFFITQNRLLELKDRMGMENVARSSEFEGYGFN